MKTRTNIPAPDRLTAPAIGPHDAAWRSAVQPYDTAVARVENTWGSLARLVRHATPETAAKFGRATHAFQEALEQAAAGQATADDVAKFGGAVVRGIGALEREAGDPGPTRFMAYLDKATGKHLVIGEREDDGLNLAKQFPGAMVFSVPEISTITLSAATSTTRPRNTSASSLTSVRAAPTVAATLISMRSRST